MSKLSVKNIAEAIYDASHDKSGNELGLVLKRSAQVLKDKRMLGKSKDVLIALQKMIDKKTNTIRAKVTTAKPLSPSERKKIEEGIKEKYKGEVIVSEFFENRELLGGMRVEVENEILDTTYRARLEKLEKFLMK
ncbi:MAG: F0F1 ATP synthase subunit delta [Candidatus Pacebacteria bacterium]|nr:F0F1 ATP synthase subunit delta [Candidatus Paceibacterota bacterium]MBP9851530.1 F0F1 ATP synthase subunit delta [Candidatus Paceibacterota bacterium]